MPQKLPYLIMAALILGLLHWLTACKPTIYHEHSHRHDHAHEHTYIERTVAPVPMPHVTLSDRLEVRPKEGRVEF